MDNLYLERLNTGDRVSLTTGEESEQAVYTFTVEVVGENPTGQLSLRKHDGTVVGPRPTTLEGCLIKDSKTSSDRLRGVQGGHIVVGGLIVIVDPTISSLVRRLYLPECRDISVEWA